MATDATVSESIAPPDGMAKYLADRQQKKAGAAPPEPAAEPVAEPETPEPQAAAAVEPETPPAPFIDPETEEEIANPTRNDRRRARLWREREEARAEAARLRALLDERNAASPVETPQTAGRPETTQALTPDQQLEMAARQRIRPEPDEREIGTTYPTHESYIKACAIWGGELAAEKRAILSEQRTAQERAVANQQAYAQHYQEQAKLYPDFAERIAEAGDAIDLGPVITDVVINTPELAGHLTYWAATHPEEVARIKALPPHRILVEMGKVMAGVSASPAPGEAPRKRSSAPPPLSDLGRPAGQATTRLEDASSYSEFAARREAQIRARRATR